MRSGEPELTEAQAVVAAQPHAAAMSVAPVKLVSVQWGPVQQFVPGPTAALGGPDRRVWVLEFEGAFRPVGGPITPGRSRHVPPASTTVAAVMLDFTSGAFVMSRFGTWQPG